MLLRSRRWRLCLAVALTAVSALLLLPIGGAQTPPEGVEVRLASRVNADGSFSVGLQYFADGRWRGMTPTRSMVPADTALGVWRHSSVLSVPTPQTQVEISTQHEPWQWTEGPGEFIVTIDELRYRTSCRELSVQLRESDIELNVPDGDCEADRLIPIANAATASAVGRQAVRIAARRGVDGRVELGLQRRAAGRWEALMQPDDPQLPTRPTVGRWYVTSPLRLAGPPPRVTAALRRGAALAPLGTELRLTVDGASHTSACGWLQLSSLTNTIMVDTRSNDCAETRPLVTICSAGTPSSECDVQQNLAYEWERVQPGVGIADDVNLSRREAQTIVNAIWSDYTQRARPPTVIFSTSQAHGHYSSGEHQIVLGTGVQILGSVIHELAHALVDHSARRDPGHGGRFTAMLLQVWESHLPIVDPALARIDAEAYGLEVADAAPLRPQSDTGAAIVEEALCGPQPKSAALCRAFAGELDELSDAAASGLYVGRGSRGDGLWWGAYIDEASGALRSHIAVESTETTTDGSVARLSIECNPKQELELDVWWRDGHQLPGDQSYRFSEQAWQDTLWQTLSGGTWGTDGWSIHRAVDSPRLLRELLWFAQGEQLFAVRHERNGRQYNASFKLDGVFQTPVQPALIECGLGKALADPGETIFDYGRSGEDLWWGVDEDERPPRTYVVRDTLIDGSFGTARLNINCEDGRLELDLYWEVERDLDWTVRWWISSGVGVVEQTEEWKSGWGTWSGQEYKWTGREDAAGLLAQLFWAAQSDGAFTAAVHERDRPSRRYTATWPLDGLFETPVQPNLARCGR